MKKEFAVFDPTTGLYTHVPTESEAIDLFTSRALAFALGYFSNVPYMNVTTNDDGTEQWATPDGTSMSQPFVKLRERVVAIANPTTVASLP